MGKVKVTISGFLKRILATRQVFFPYRTLVTTQCLAVNTSSCWSSRLAAVAFSMGQQEQGESLCKECATVQDWSGLLKLETDFAKVLQLFLRRRKGRHMLAFEVMYFLRQFPKASRHHSSRYAEVPGDMLLAIKESVAHAMEGQRLAEDGPAAYLSLERSGSRRCAGCRSGQCAHDPGGAGPGD